MEIDGIDIRIRPLVEQRNLFRSRYKDHEMEAAFKAKLLETIVNACLSISDTQDLLGKFQEKEISQLGS